MNMKLPFKDRSDAGKQLAEELAAMQEQLMKLTSTVAALDEKDKGSGAPRRTDNGQDKSGGAKKKGVGWFSKG